MRTVIIDDEAYVLRYIERLCGELPELEVSGCFENAVQALDFLRKQSVELVIMDIHMPGMDGMEAVRRIRLYAPDTPVIFVTGYEQYALDAFRLEAVAYIMKPCGAEELRSAVRRAARLLPDRRKRVEVVTFGYFQVRIDDVPVRFSNSKAQELLALLVDREGAAVSMEQATDILWEGRPYDDTVKRLYRKATGYLKQLFRENGTGIFVSDRGSSHVVPAEFDCDYYRLMRGDEEAAKRYNGEYMSQYSWAEATVGRIVNYLDRGW